METRHLQEEGEGEGEGEDGGGGGGGGSSGGSSSGTSANDSLPDYIVSAYGKCTCYTTCGVGVQKRTVLCEAEKCRAPKPQEQRGCTCSPCVHCEIDMLLFIIMITYVVQAVVALIVLLSFLYFGTKDVDDLASLNCLEKLLGFFCKKFPVYVRVLSLIGGVLIVVFIGQVMIPGWFFHCHGDTEIRDDMIISAAIFLVQLLFGFFGKKTVQPPAWLYTPVRPGRGIVYAFVAMLRSMGP